MSDNNNNKNSNYDKNDISQNDNNNNNVKSGDMTIHNSELTKTKNRSLKQNWLKSVRNGQQIAASNAENKEVLTSSLKEET